MAKDRKIGKKSLGKDGSHHKLLDYLTTDGELPSPNKQLMERIQVAAAGGKQGGWSAGNTELDDHKNMVVIGGQGKKYSIQVNFPTSMHLGRMLE